MRAGSPVRQPSSLCPQRALPIPWLSWRLLCITVHHCRARKQGRTKPGLSIQQTACMRTRRSLTLRPPLPTLPPPYTTPLATSASNIPLVPAPHTRYTPTTFPHHPSLALTLTAIPESRWHGPRPRLEVLCSPSPPPPPLTHHTVPSRFPRTPGPARPDVVCGADEVPPPLHCPAPPYLFSPGALSGLCPPHPADVVRGADEVHADAERHDAPRPGGRRHVCAQRAQQLGLHTLPGLHGKAIRVRHVC